MSLGATLASDRLDEFFVILFAVIVGELFAPGDVSDGVDHEATCLRRQVAIYLDLAVWVAPMVDVARGIAALGSVYRPSLVYLEQVSRREVIRHLGGDPRPRVLEYKITLAYGRGCKEPMPRAPSGPADDESRVMLSCSGLHTVRTIQRVRTYVKYRTYMHL